MNKQDIREIYEYNYWANYLLLDMTEKVTPEQFVTPSSHSFSSLQGTLVHILDAEWGWRVLLQSQGSTPLLKAEDFPTVDVLRQRWQEEEKAMWDYINRLSDEDLMGIVRYPGDEDVTRERVLWHCLFHVINHGMQHRSEAANLLTTYGQSPGEIDFTVFLNERKAKQKQA
ncbi:MAG: DinB family protein [Anaerolineae bacterium]|nr:DinB family protein [Anaerolineae bacterium]